MYVMYFLKLSIVNINNVMVFICKESPKYNYNTNINIYLALN